MITPKNRSLVAQFVSAVAFAFLPTLLQAQTASNAGTWQTFAPDGEEFSVSLPAQPRIATSNFTVYPAKGEPFSAKGTMYAVVSNGSLFSIQAFETEQPQKVLEAILGKAFPGPNGPAPPPSFAKDFFLKRNTFTTLNRLYVVSAASRDETDKRLMLFLNSFTLKKPSATKNLPPKKHQKQKAAKPSAPPPSVATSTGGEAARPPMLPSMPTLKVDPALTKTPRNMEFGDPDSNATEVSRGKGSGAGLGPGRGENTGGGDGAAKKPETDYNRPFTAKEVTRKAVVFGRPQPSYTNTARKNEVVGTVVVRVLLGANGTIMAAMPIVRLPDDLVEQAVNAAKLITFLPAEKDGKTVSQWVQVEYSFNLY